MKWGMPVVVNRTLRVSRAGEIHPPSPSLRPNNTPSAGVKNFNAERTDRTARGNIHGDKWHFIGKPAARASHGNVREGKFLKTTGTT